MKIYYKLITGFLGISFLIGIVGVISVLENLDISRNALQISSNTTKEAKSAEINASLQIIQMISREILLEAKQGPKGQLEDKQDSKDQQNSSQIKTKRINDELEKVKLQVANIKQKTEGLIKQGNHEEINKLVILDELGSNLSSYNILVRQYLQLSLSNPAESSDFLDSTLEPYFNAKLFPLLRSYQAAIDQELKRQITEIQTSITNANRLIIGSIISTTGLAICLSLLISHSISTPLVKLTKSVAKAGKDGLGTRIDLIAQDEFGILATAFNQMMDDLSITSVSQSYLDDILNSILDLLVVINVNRKITKVNQATLKLLGYQEEELINQKIHILFSEDTDFEFEKLFKQGFIGKVETNYVTKAGDRIPVSFLGSLMWDHQQQVQGIVCLARDLTERKKREQELQTSKAKNQALLNAIPDLIFRIHRDGTYLDFKADNHEDLAVPADQIIGAKVQDSLPPSLARQRMYFIEQALTTQQPQTFEYQILVNQELRDQEARVVVNGEDEVLVIVSDITGRRRLERSWASINEVFLSFGTDPTENMNRLIHLCGKLLGATCALYNRLERGLLCSIEEWQTPPGYPAVGISEGYLCLDGIQHGSSELWVVPDLAQTSYAQSDPNVMAYGLKTYMGQAVKSRGATCGFLCAVFQTDFAPNEVDQRIMGILVAALSVEEERLWTQSALHESEERYALAAQGANDGLWDWNLKTQAVYFSERWKSLLGLQDEEMETIDHWFQRVHPEDIEGLWITLADHLEGLTPHFEFEFRMLHQDGTYHWMLSRGSAIRDPDHHPYRLAGSQTDITKRKQTEEKILYEMSHDLLTGLPNRAAFEARLQQSVEKAQTFPEHRFAVMLLDVDRFKGINDSLGHEFGDHLLIAIAHRLKTVLSPQDTLARLEADEFAILIAKITDTPDAIQIAEQILTNFQQPFQLNDQEVFTTASIGIAFSDPDKQTKDLIRHADTAMYRAKTGGKARYETFTEAMHKRAVMSLNLENDLRRAIEHQEFYLHYQPIMALSQGKLLGFEALVRWRHPEHGLVSPAEFIPVAEETGLIIPLSYWILRQACQQMQAWRQQFPSYRSFSVSVNLSGKHFSQPTLIENIQAILQETQMEGRYLTIEITESVILENATAVMETLQKLRSLGMRLSIDDFGTGYSSLSYLHCLPLDTLKIDRSFINRIDIDGEKLELVRTIVNLAWNLGMSVIAEGVETSTQLAQLKALRCDAGQGFFFSKPLDSQTAGEFIDTQIS
ncbi:MAG: EAL domain-containing protein [Leptolyngbyaceae bacterium]|nr:EAL domain-containing protein [Leptolyngbyaceae bacterium]